MKRRERPLLGSGRLGQSTPIACGVLASVVDAAIAAMANAMEEVVVCFDDLHVVNSRQAKLGGHCGTNRICQIGISVAEATGEEPTQVRYPRYLADGFMGAILPVINMIAPVDLGIDKSIQAVGEVFPEATDQGGRIDTNRMRDRRGRWPFKGR